jgi:hypothetical protein
VDLVVKVLEEVVENLQVLRVRVPPFSRERPAGVGDDLQVVGGGRGGEGGGVDGRDYAGAYVRIEPFVLKGCRRQSDLQGA